MENSAINLVTNTWGNGGRIKKMVLGSLSLSMEIFIKGILRIIKKMEMGFKYTQMEMSMMEFG